MRIEADDLIAGYDGRDVLRGVSLRVDAREMVGLIGPNGAGKSTLLRALSRTLPLRRGTVRLDGDPLERLSALKVARRLAFVPQAEPALFEFTVREVVLMGRHAHVSRAAGEADEDFQAALRAMAATDTLHLADRPITALSGGEHRRVLLARALAQAAPTLLLDEPTAHLDLTHQTEVLALTRRLVDRDGVSILVALHDLNLAAEFCDRLVLLAQGRVVADGTADDVLTAPALSEVYGAPVRVGRSPTSGRPQVYVVPPPQTDAADPAPRVHVVCGGGTGLAVIPALIRRGCVVTAGVLNRLDSDEEAARALGVECATEAPFCGIGADARRRCSELMACADVVVLTDVPIGRGNLANIELVADAQEQGKPVLVVGEGDARTRDFTGGAAAALIEGMLARGAEWVPDVLALEERVRAHAAGTGRVQHVEH